MLHLFFLYVYIELVMLRTLIFEVEPNLQFFIRIRTKIFKHFIEPELNLKPTQKFEVLTKISSLPLNTNNIRYEY